MKMWCLLFVCSLFVAACDTGPSTQPEVATAAEQPNPSPSPSPSATPRPALDPGQWGGDGISLTVTDDGATFQLDCAHGTIDQPIRPDRSGNFRNTGTIAKESESVPTPTPTPQERDARFTGNVRDGSMFLTISWTEDGERMFMRFLLTEGDPGQIERCL